MVPKLLRQKINTFCHAKSAELSNQLRQQMIHEAQKRLKAGDGINEIENDLFSHSIELKLNQHQSHGAD